MTAPLPETAGPGAEAASPAAGPAASGSPASPGPAAPGGQAPGGAPAGGSSGPPPLTEDPGAQAARSAAQQMRTAENVLKADTVQSGIGHNSGAVYNNYYQRSGEARPEASTFEDELREAGDLPGVPDPLPFEAALVERYLITMLSGRVLVIEHHPGVKPLADHAWAAVARSLLGTPACQRMLVEAFDRLFPLHRLYQTPTWGERTQRSLILLDRSRDEDVSHFLRDNLKMGVLRKQLDSMEAYLLVVVASAAPRLASSDRPHVWRFDPPSRSTPAPVSSPASGSESDAAPAPASTTAPVQDSLPDTMDPFDVLLTMCATWFSGLAALEFRTLVDALLPPPAQADATPKPRVPRSMAGAAPPVASREQRWRDGDVDRVLGEVGIAFMPPTGPWGTNAGYQLVDPVRRTAAGEWMLQRFPALLARQVEKLTGLYFTAGASMAYRDATAAFLLRLDAAQAHRIYPSWLVQRFLELGLGHTQSPSQLVAFIVAALDRADAEAFARDVAAELVRHAGEAERTLVEALRRAPPDAGSGMGDAADRFWSRLDASDEGDEGFLRTRNLLEHVVGTLLLLCRRAASLGVEGLYPLLEGQSLVVPDGADGSARIDSLARLVVRTQLIQVLDSLPFVWLAIAEAVAAPKEPGLGEPAWPAARRALAAEVLLALSYHVQRAGEGTLAAELHDMLFGDTHRPRAAQALAGLVLALLPSGERQAAEDSVGPEWVMWLFRTLAAVTLRRQPRAPAAAAVPLQALAAPLRAGLRAAQRREISQCARDTQDVLLSRRDYFESIGQRDALAAERQSLQAMQVVVRAFSAAASVPAPG